MRRLFVVPLALSLLAGCAASRPAADAAPVVDVAALQAERDSLRAVARAQDEAIGLLTDSVGTLRHTNEALVGRRRPAGTPPGQTAAPSPRTTRTPPRTEPPARTAPPKPAPAPIVQADPTTPDLPQEAFADTLTADELFLPASATVSPLGEAILDRVAYELSRMPPAVRIRVEGHADSTPPGPTIRERWPSNWELSSARAAAVIRFIVGKGIDEGRFELVSFAATRPVAANDTPQARARNRRVIIVAR